MQLIAVLKIIFRTELFVCLQLKDMTKMSSLQLFIVGISSTDKCRYIFHYFQLICYRSIGLEYELRLERELRLMNITFSDENVLRARGYDKTPDFKLDIPIAIDGFIVNWIESKALFGDEENHAGYLKEQLLCYWNRFGPGLVIYWFGYLETLESTPEVNNLFILRTGFPDKSSITQYHPDF